VTADAGRLPAGAGLLFATKGHQLAAAIASMRAAWPAADDRVAWVGGLQNGLAKDDLLAAAFGAEQVVGAVTILGGQREADGTVLVTSRGATYLGEFDAAPSPRVRAAVAALQRADIPVEAAPDIRSVLWSKACNAAGVFGVSVLTRLAGARMMRRPDLGRAFLSLIREVEAIATAYSVTLGDYTNFPIRTYLTTPEAEMIARFSSQPLPPPGARPVLPSMTQDLLAGRALEVDEVFSDLLERAERASVPVPRLTLTRDLIRGIDPGHYPE
jgi:2-dehydropantoate 2-reductase